MAERERFYAKSRASWRAWLSHNHQTSPGVWLVYDKGAKGARALSPDAISEEAICFGWIDSLPRKLDAARAMLYVSPRKEKSNWSAANRARAERMVHAGKMAPAGKRMVALAKKRGTWKALVPVQASVIPPDLKRALKANPKASAYFTAFPPSSKRIILEWILNAKKPETRSARIKETVRLAARDIRANHYRQ